MSIVTGCDVLLVGIVEVGWNCCCVRVADELGVLDGLIGPHAGGGASWRGCSVTYSV